MFKATTRTNTTSLSTAAAASPHGDARRTTRNTGRRIATAAVLATITLAATACSPSKDSGELLVAQLPSEAISGGATGVTLWSANPGDELNDANTVATDVSNIASIVSQDHDGNVWLNSVGRKWDGKTLLAFMSGQDGKLTVGKPGGEPATLASPLVTEPEVILRGVLAQTQNGCTLAASATEVEEIASGRCVISPQERYVVSWGGTEPGLSIKDLANDHTETVDLEVSGADALSKDDAVLAVAKVADGFQAVVIDASDGSERGRSGTFPQMQAGVAGKTSEGFVVQVQKSDGKAALLYVDSKGAWTEIDSGDLLYPLQNGHEVTYLKFAAEPEDGELRRWSNGHEPETLLAGNVGGAAVDDHDVIASREADGVVTFYRTNHGTGEMEPELEIPSAAASDPSGLAVRRTLLLNGTVHLTLDNNGESAYARLDLGGKHSDVPIEGARALTFHALDADGTALLSSAGETSAELLTVRLHDHDPDVRAQAGTFGPSFIRAGQVYFTDATDQTNPSVKSVRAIGSDDTVTTLWDSKMLVGATWPQAGGSTETTFVTRRLFVEQQQQAAQQAMQQDQAGGAPSGAAGGPG